MGIKLVVFTFETALNILLIIVDIKDPLKIFKGSIFFVFHPQYCFCRHSRLRFRDNQYNPWHHKSWLQNKQRNWGCINLCMDCHCWYIPVFVSCVYPSNASVVLLILYSIVFTSQLVFVGAGCTQHG